jgi:hypothetical protein
MGSSPTTSVLLYEDDWGCIILRPDQGLMETRWYDTTADMTADEFNQWLATFAGFVEDEKTPRVLVDATAFRMDPSLVDPSWRDANVIPRYVAAGVRKFAFQMPAGMPAIGSPPAPEGPADFPTGYFGSRRAALTWLLVD